MRAQRFARPAAAALGAMAATLPSGCTTSVTQVVVSVDTEAPARVVSMRVAASRGASRSASPNVRAWVRNGAPDDFVVPASFGVVAGDGPRDQTVTLQIQLQFAPTEPGRPLVTAERTARFRIRARARGPFERARAQEWTDRALREPCGRVAADPIIAASQAELVSIADPPARSTWA